MEIICYRAGGGESKENTLEAIKHCIKVNPDWRIEIDLRLTKDHQVVLLHDQNLNRTHGIDIDIKDITYSDLTTQLSKYKKDHIPTLESVLLQFSNQKWVFDLHAQNPIIVDRIILLVEKFKLENRVVIVSEYDNIISGLQQKRSSWQQASATNEARKIILFNKLRISKLYNWQSNVLAIPKRIGRISLLSPRLVHDLKCKKKQVWIFGDDMKKILKNRSHNLPIASQKYSKKELKYLESLGVDAVFTDFPEFTKRSIS